MIGPLTALAAVYKCIAPDSLVERASETVQMGRLAVCAACPSCKVSRCVGMGGVLSCGDLGEKTATTCGCVVGGLTPSDLRQVDEVGLDDARRPQREARAKALAHPLCKVTVLGESCPRGKWLGRVS